MRVEIFSVRGELVRTLLDGVTCDAGAHPVVWEGDNNQGSKVASGVYFYEVRAAGEQRVGKLTLVK